jgi:hypothetical protein
MFFIYNSNGLRVMDAYLHRYVVVADDDSFNNIICKRRIHTNLSQNHRYLISCALRVHRIAFVSYAHNKKIGKTNNLGFFGTSKPHCINRIATLVKCTCTGMRLTLVLINYIYLLQASNICTCILT